MDEIPKKKIPALVSLLKTNAAKPGASSSAKQVAAMAEAAQAHGRRISNVTTIDGHHILVSQLGKDGLIQSALDLQRNPSAFKGKDPYVLAAMGLNPSLATKPYKKGTTHMYNPATHKELRLPTAAEIKAGEAGESARIQQAQDKAKIKLMNTAITTANTDKNPKLAAYIRWQIAQTKYKDGLSKVKPGVAPPAPESNKELLAYRHYLNNLKLLKLKTVQAIARLQAGKTTLAATQSTIAASQKVLAKSVQQKKAYNVALLKSLDTENQISAVTNIEQARLLRQPIKTYPGTYSSVNVAKQYAKLALKGTTAVAPKGQPNIVGIATTKSGSPLIATNLKQKVAKAVSQQHPGPQVVSSAHAAAVVKA